MTLHNVTDHGSLIHVTIPDGKTLKKRSFTIVGDDWINLYRKYRILRPEMQENRLFIKYNRGKCTRNVMGIHKIGSVAKEVALYFKIPNWKEYTGYCLKSTSATVLADCGGDISFLKRYGGWKSDTVAAGYIEESLQNKKDIATKILLSNNNSDLAKACPTASVASTSDDNETSINCSDEPDMRNEEYRGKQQDFINTVVQSYSVESKKSSESNTSAFLQNATLNNCIFNFNLK